MIVQVDTNFFVLLTFKKSAMFCNCTISYVMYTFEIKINESIPDYISIKVLLVSFS